jgi:hypothetical protein
MQPATAVGLRLRAVPRALTHLVRWVHYHAGMGARASGSPAALTLYTSSGRSRYRSDGSREREVA